MIKKPDCTTGYAGTIWLDDPTEHIGMPTGQSTYLVFVFERSGLFSAETSSTHDTLMRPAGYRCSTKVSDEDNIGNVILNESAPGGQEGRASDTRGMHTCRPV